MKILKIAFRNINSLKGEHEIDFSSAPFTTSSLFAITGPTGSGKSTILDVISLALFNKIPRLERISKGEINKTGAILTRNQREAMASVTYESRNGRFTSEWSISTARTGSLREYDMQLSEHETGKLLDLKKSEVPGRNEELIGLNYNQFIKSVLLAQGEFAQFLKAKKDERGELLEKITGTGIYRMLGKRSYEKFKEVNKEIESHQHRISAIQEQLLEEDRETAYRKELEQKNCSVQDLEKSIEKLKKQLELKQQIAAREKEIETRTSLKKSAEAKLEKFEKEHGQPLRQHEKVEVIAEDLRSWSRCREEINAVEQEIRSFSERLQHNGENRAVCLKEAEDLTETKINAANVADELEAFRRKVSALQQERRETGMEYFAVRNLLQRELQALAFQLNEKDPEQNQQQLHHLQKASEEKIELLRSKLDGIDTNDPDAEKKRLNEQLGLAREAWRKDDEIKGMASEIRRFREEENTLSASLENFPFEIETAKGKTELFQERLEKLAAQKENQLLRASLEEHRHALKNGEPCPLCGALEHPFATDLPEKENSLDLQLQTTGRELEEWKKKLATLSANFKSGKERIEVITGRRQELEKNLENRKEDFTSRYAALCAENENPNWEEMCHNWQEQVEQMEALQREKQKYEAILSGFPLVEKLEKLHSRGTKLKEELEQLYRGADISTDTGKITSRWTQLQQEQKNISEQLQLTTQRKNKNLENLEELEERLNCEVQALGFSYIQEAREALLPEETCRRLRSEREDITKQITSTAASLSLLQTQLEEAKKTDVAETTDNLKKSLVEEQEKLTSTSAECRELYSHVKNHETNLQRLKEIREQISEKETQIRRWRLLNELIGDATGKKFNDFAQDLSLGKLLHLANIRLKDLSDRYRIDKPGDQEDDALVAIDEHMGGQRRSVKTLSGGETFLLSLSMALALSDLASRNVEINSLFIDEGFGTLDPETLDQTLDTLEKLQAESSKTIGIISHVDSLKERIATQIKLKRNGQGYSQLEIVPQSTAPFGESQ